MKTLKDTRQVPVNQRLQPLATIQLGQFSREELTQLVWDQSSNFARALMIHKDFAVSSKSDMVQFVILGQTAFERSILRTKLGEGMLFDPVYMADWSKSSLNGQCLVPCEAEDIVQLWAQRILQLSPEDEDILGSSQVWSSMRPLPEPYGMRFHISTDLEDDQFPRGLGANQYGVGNCSASNIFHRKFGAILYRLVEA